MVLLPVNEIINRILNQYSLAKPKSIELLNSSNRNENFVILDANENKYILRRYRRNDDKARAMFQLKLQQHLFDNNFPTSEILKTISGEPILTIDNMPWALFTFVEGIEYDFSRPEQAGEAGRRLAQFHKILNSFHEEPVYLDFNLPLREVYMKSASNLAQLDKMFSNQGVNEELSGCRRWWDKLMNDLPLAVLDRLPSGWIHRDYHGRNMLFSGDNMCGLFDFDELTKGPFACDVAFGLHMFGREYRGSREIRPEFAHSFLGGYSSIRHVTRDEIEAIVNHKRDGDDVREMLIREVGELPDVEVEGNQLRSILAGM
jgi:Ser/Thr protein kinase RdoA (MazF antagonist)